MGFVFDWIIILLTILGPFVLPRLARFGATIRVMAGVTLISLGLFLGVLFFGGTPLVPLGLAFSIWASVLLKILEPRLARFGTTSRIMAVLILIFGLFLLVRLVGGALHILIIFILLMVAGSFILRRLGRFDAIIQVATELTLVCLGLFLVTLLFGGTSLDWDQHSVLSNILILFSVMLLPINLIVFIVLPPLCVWLGFRILRGGQ